MPAGFHLLISAQFASALADNALLIVTIALLQEQGQPAWWAPLLKVGFTVWYVLLAPLVGDLADAMPKARLMAWMNGVKAAAALSLLAGVHPVLAFCVAGLGAAAYAPAKYGLLTEIVPARHLVAANGWVEVSVVCAALLGTVLGGFLVSAWVVDSALGETVRAGVERLSGMSSSLSISLALLLGVYLVAGLLNLGVGDSGVRYARGSFHPVALVRNFWRSNAVLWKDADGGLSLAVTTLFWGVGATLQFAVLRWSVDILGLPLSQSAYLQAAVAVGVVLGAGLAGRLVPLSRARHMLGAGVLLGLMMPLVAATRDVVAGTAWLALAGALGGLMVVPLNALLQHRGAKLLSAGRSIAVQGFNENASVLAMLGTYAALLALDLPIVTLMNALGVGIAATIGGLMLREWLRSRRMPPGT